MVAPKLLAEWNGGDHRLAAKPEYRRFRAIAYDDENDARLLSVEVDVAGSAACAAFWAPVLSDEMRSALYGLLRSLHGRD